MAALTRMRAQTIGRWTHHEFTLATGSRAFQGGLAVGDMSTGKVEPAHPGVGLLALGWFDADVDATEAERPVTVNLGKEIEVRWLDNDGSIGAANVFQACYFADDHTVTATSTNNALAGRIWAVDAVRGVAVELVRRAGF